MAFAEKIAEVLFFQVSYPILHETDYLSIIRMMNLDDTIQFDEILMMKFGCIFC